jgi:hypothetical protein
MAVPRGQQTLAMDMQDQTLVQQPLRARSPCTARRRESIPSCVVTQRAQWASFLSPFLQPPPPPPRPAKTGPRPTATSATAPKTMPPRATHHTPVPRLLCQMLTLRLPNSESNKNHCVCPPPPYMTKVMLFVPLPCVWWRWMLRQLW